MFKSALGLLALSALVSASPSPAPIDHDVRGIELGLGLGIGLFPPHSKPQKPSGPQTVLLYKTFLSIGCWSDDPSARLLHDFEASVSPLTVEACIDTCNAKGLALAGVEFGQECFCGNAIEGDQGLISRSSCDTACTGNSKELCGGANAINLYLNLLKPFVTAGPPFMVTHYKKWKFLECTADNGPERQLPFRQDQIPVEDQTVQLCLDTCAKQGFTVGALQFAQECWCGNVDLPFPEVDVSNCNAQCTDEANEFCGGSGFNQVYYLPNATFTST